MISLIAVIGKNKELGKAGKLLWHLPDDLKHFKDITQGHSVVMGRKTFESIGSPLPNRRNIILTRDKNLHAPGCKIMHSFDEIINKAKKIDEEIFIIGGGQIYEQFIPYAQKLYLTIVDDAPEADTFFPDYSEFKNIVNREKKAYNNIKFEFIELTKNGKNNYGK
ncbi:MAG: dihydrofolate reductase [Patescibacteria group bacterium]